MNKLYYGDNLPILRNHEYFPNECVDLIYLDPPFNSSRNYNVLFKDESGRDSDAQITAFEDTWHWGQTAEETFHDIVKNAPPQVVAATNALRWLVGANQMMAYLVMMTARLVELHRVLKPTGSLYLHCDPSASHYLKIILDAIFGPQQFRNEIIWKRTTTHSDAKRWSPVSDTILYYTKTATFTWNPQYTEHEDEYVSDKYRYDDKDGRGSYRLDNMTSPNPRPNLMYEWNGFAYPPKGWRYSKETMAKLDSEGRIWYPQDKTKRPQLKRYLNEISGRIADNVWTDINPVNSQARERLNYPTQKPISLLERIINASSNRGDIILDPFCGCGTAIAAAQKLGRTWIGIDVTHLSIALMKYRMRDMYDLKAGVDYKVIGEPEDVAGARQLSQEDRYQFQWWALSQVEAKPLGGQEGSRTGKKGSDRGIDGVINFVESGNKVARALVQVKSGKVKSGDIRDLRGVVEREGAAIGIFITLEEPSREMTTEAVSAGFYESPGWSSKYPKIQILTIEQLLNGETVKMPGQFGTFKQAPRVKPETNGQTLPLFEDEG